MIENIFIGLKDNDEITFAFQGGEPTLAGLQWYEDFVKTVTLNKKNIRVHYSFQTNGLLINQSWGDFFSTHKFLVGLSVDSGSRFHDLNRVDMEHAGTYQRIMASKKLLDECKVEYNILCVLTNELAKNTDKAWSFILREKIRYIQYIPCLEEFEVQNQQKNTLRPANFANFYSKLLARWIEELEKGNYISVKLFDDVVNYFYKGITTACGIDGQCHTQYVVEADGSVYPCDFFALDDYKAGNITEQTFDAFNSNPVMISFLHEKRTLPPICGRCVYLKLCRGGCKRMQRTMYYGNDGVICGFKIFLDKSLGRLEYAVKFFSNG
ncbi:radical SAM/SPASM domain-containing protein [Spirochaetia bacterium]|nr:radical SAM/SPASM domain-containing protein [Spirochaetia bacterium]